MDDLFGRFFGDWPLASWSGGAEWWPAIDVAEHDDKVIVRAELPGVTADDLDISVLDNTLTISGEKKETKEDKGENYYHAERRYGAFRRVVQLPAAVDPEKVEARCRDGVLTLELPKDRAAMPRRIEVKK